MKRTNSGYANRERKRQDAAQRQAEWGRLTSAEKRARVEKMPGQARKQRRQLGVLG